MKEWLSKACVHTLKQYILFLAICQSSNYKTTLQSAEVGHFSEKFKKNCFDSSWQ